MHNETPPPDHDMSAEDVRSFFAIGRATVEKADFLLYLHYNGIHNLGLTTVQKVCEFHALGSGFENYLENVFKRIDDVPENTVFKINAAHASTIVQMIYSIVEVKYEITKSGVNLEDH
jgi:hypothetical protein